ncbi:MAG: hypothetical protein AB7K35_12680 [Pseudorhodoplanes sp.]
MRAFADGAYEHTLTITRELFKEKRPMNTGRPNTGIVPGRIGRRTGRDKRTDSAMLYLEP